MHWQVHERKLRARLAAARDECERAAVIDEMLVALIDAAPVERVEPFLACVEDSEALGPRRPRINALRVLVDALQGRPTVETEAEVLAQIASLGEGEDLAVCLLRLGFARMVRRNYVQAEQYALEALRICSIAEDPYHASYAALLLGTVAFYARNPEDVLYYSEQAIGYALTAGNAHMYVQGLIVSYDTLCGLGRWNDAKAVRRALRGVACDRDMSDILFIQAYHDAELLVLEGRVAAALERLERTEVDLPGTRAMLKAFVALLRAGLCEDDVALREARQAASLAASQRAQSLAHLNAISDENRRWVGAIMAACVLVLVGHRHDGLRRLRARLDLPGPYGALARAGGSAVLGEACEVAPDLGHCRGHVDVMLAVCEQRTRRVREQLRGILTQTELEVVHAACDGATNRAIAQERAVSLSAVERVLTRAYRKLGVGSRFEALRRLRALALEDDPAAGVMAAKR
jgi:DNA-binding CsgD family transcriptional regulator